MNSTIETMASLEKEETLFPYLEMGGAFVIGLSIGFVLKKSFKLLLLFLGLGLIFVFLLERQGAVNVNEENLQNIVSMGMDSFKSMAAFLQNRLEHYHSLGAMSAIAGFFVGIKIG